MFQPRAGPELIGRGPEALFERVIGGVFFRGGDPDHVGVGVWRGRHFVDAVGTGGEPRCEGSAISSQEVQSFARRSFEDLADDLLCRLLREVSGLMR